MARTIKPEAVAAKRNQILDAAQRLMFTKGFDHMSIQDILDDIRISSGAFHHYFDSRRALLDAFIERMKLEVEPPLQAVIDDKQLSAAQKLQGFLDTLSRLRLEHRAAVVELLRAWYGDGNAVVRQRVDEAIWGQRVPLLGAIIAQGVRERVFTAADPELAGEVVMSLLQGLSSAQARLILAIDREREQPGDVHAIIATHAAYMDAIERVLGAPAGSLARGDAAAVGIWLAALRASDSSPIQESRS